MRIWNLVKETYKGTKYVVSELNQGLDTVNKSLEIFNTEQKLKRPLKVLLHDAKIKKITLKSIEYAIPSTSKEGQLLLENAYKLFDWMEKLMIYGIENQNGCRDIVLMFSETFGNSGYLNICSTDLFLEKYPLAVLKANGYQQQSSSTTEAYEKILQIKFAYFYDATNIEENYRMLNYEFDHETLILANTFTDNFNKKFGLRINHLK